LPDLLPKNAVPVVFREVDQSFLLKLLSTLQGGNSAVSDYLLGNISSRMADQYRDDLGGMKLNGPGGRGAGTARIPQRVDGAQAPRV
jgi:flagellar motor switch protein FliG